MFCCKCGKEINKEDKFCDNCGAIINNDLKQNYWKWVQYAWTVIVNLITLGVVIGIYSSLYDSFEKIVVSILILIYLSIQTLSITHGNFIIENMFSNHAEFERVRKLIRGNNEIDENEELEKETMEEIRKKIDKAKVKMYINIGFSSIIYLIALINLFGAL